MKINNLSKISRIFLISAFSIGISIISIAWSTLSTEVRIDGSSGVKSSSWNINFSNISSVFLEGTAEQVMPPKIEATRIYDYKIILNAPKDSASYEVTIKNDGSFDGEISSVTISNPICTGNGDNAVVDAKNVCDNIEFSLKYKDSNENLKIGDSLLKGEEKVAILKIKYNELADSSLLPKDDVLIENLSIILTYRQTN